MDEYFKRFPYVLRKALMEKKVFPPDNLIKEFEDISVYRGIRLVNGEKEVIEKDDFLSQAERGLPGVDYEDIYNYSCSCFEEVKELQLCFRLPRKNKGIAKGVIKCKKGSIVKDKEGTHIHWFLYNNVNPSEDFEVVSYEKMD